MNWMDTIVAAGATTGAAFAAKVVYDAVTVRWMERQTFKAKLHAYQQRQAVKALQHIPADQLGHGGWMVRPDGAIVNVDTLTKLNADWQVEVIDEMRERLAAMERLLRASGAQPGQVTDVMPANAPLLPEFVSSDLLDAAPSYRRLVLGRTEHETVTADMASLVHVAVGGSSGWGKSVFLRWLCWQLAKSTDPVNLALIDLEGATLAPFENCKRVLYPVADTERDAAAVMAELTGELDRRRELYAHYPGVDSLYAYNDQADEPLTPIVAVVDEATALLENKTVERHLRTLALRARKYGLWLVLAGQDWKASTLDTAIRNQLGARVHFRAMSATQSRVLLGQAGAEEIEVKGRAMAVLPGRAPITFQSPMIKHSQIRGLGNGGPLYDMPERSREPRENDKAARVLDLHEQGQSDTAIARAVFGHGTTFYIEKVRDILETS